MDDRLIESYLLVSRLVTEQLTLIQSSDPDWYYEQHDLQWWVSDLFSSIVEVHAFELGLLMGVCFGLLAARHYPRSSVLALVGVTVFLFSGVDVPVICEQRTESCAHVRLKPWYFLIGLIAGHLTVLGVSRQLGDLVPRRSWLPLSSEESE